MYMYGFQVRVHVEEPLSEAARSGVRFKLDVYNLHARRAARPTTTFSMFVFFNT